ncbi:hypothetical protein Lepto7376_4533 [[Leptolyngbya] sp. PCC 7376]|uniref:hypothetical protein n=1 Tax=[Leptolyngbya] sp. PCC 7376 TaxID=111781 RepID=UPI00029F0A44|nr:hypothetical protein [[Leptolyngbya] sp. PCC 7376]AFY40631.1 hypothetical protein Lepto7376_4533 [[Leptolyngbya] sp. PCC 7376]
MELLEVIEIEKGQIITGLPDFDAIKVFDYEPINRLRRTRGGVSYLSPLYMKLLVELNGFTTAINPTYLVDKNPELIVVNSQNLPVRGLDISGDTRLELALYRSDDMDINSILPRTATVRVLQLQRNQEKTVDFSGFMFEYFRIDQVLADLELFNDNDRLTIDVYFQGNPVQRIVINEPSSVLPDFVLSREYSLVLKANRDSLDAVKISVSEAASHQVVVIS